MTVAEIIEHLSKMDQTLDVIVSDDDELNGFHTAFDPSEMWLDEKNAELHSDEDVQEMGYEDDETKNWKRVVIL